MRSAPERFGLVLLMGAAIFLSGCGGNSDLARNFGFVRDAPDEYTVTTQPPLSMPPDFALRPPRPGAPRPQTKSERMAAAEALDPQLALQNGVPSGLSPGQQALVAQAGPPAPANIAAQVDSQASAANQPSKGFIDRLMFWRPSPQPGDVVDAQGETARLRKDAALGESPVTGATPIVKSKQKGLLEGLF